MKMAGENFVMDQTRNTLGARGIDMIEAERVFGPSGDTVMAMGKRQSYPIYDGHGNMLATLVRNGSSYTLQNEKRYDPWGGFTVGSGPGTGLANPSEAYCANLGHKSDAESDFIYMRARYYEPGSGRFISEDPAMDGKNWYTYCVNDPVNKIDESGRTADWLLAGAYVLASGVFSAIMTAIMTKGKDPAAIVRALVHGMVVAAAGMASIPALKIHSVVIGGLAGAIAGMLEAYLTGGDLVLGALTGALAGSIGGALGVVGAASLRQLELFFLLSFDVGAMVSVGGAYGQELAH